MSSALDQTQIAASAACNVYCDLSGEYLKEKLTEKQFKMH